MARVHLCVHRDAPMHLYANASNPVQMERALRRPSARNEAVAARAADEARTQGPVPAHAQDLNHVARLGQQQFVAEQ